MDLFLFLVGKTGARLNMQIMPKSLHTGVLLLNIILIMFCKINLVTSNSVLNLDNKIIIPTSNSESRPVKTRK